MHKRVFSPHPPLHMHWGSEKFPNPTDIIILQIWLSRTVSVTLFGEPRGSLCTTEEAQDGENWEGKEMSQRLLQLSP